MSCGHVGIRQTVIVLLLAACGGGDGTGTSVASIAGVWSTSIGVSNSQVNLSCQFTGTATLSQSGTTFNGSYSGTSLCTGPGGSTSDPSTGVIGGGQITGSHVTFTDDDGCNYSGTITGSPANRISGTVSCLFAISGQTYTFTGTWQVNR